MRFKDLNNLAQGYVTMGRDMMIKAVVLAFSWTALFGVPLCCCAHTPCAEEASSRKQSCGHCPKQNHSHSEGDHTHGKRLPSLPTSKECGCSHVSQDASADVVRVSIAVPSGPDAWDDVAPSTAAIPSPAPELAPFLDRGPPPERLGIPLYLFILHLAI